MQMGNLVRRMNIGCDAFLGHKQVVRIARWFRVGLLGRGSRDRSLTRPVVLYTLPNCIHPFRLFVGPFLLGPRTCHPSPDLQPEAKCSSPHVTARACPRHLMSHEKPPAERRREEERRAQLPHGDTYADRPAVCERLGGDHLITS